MEKRHVPMVPVRYLGNGVIKAAVAPLAVENSLRTLSTWERVTCDRVRVTPI